MINIHLSDCVAWLEAYEGPLFGNHDALPSQGQLQDDLRQISGSIGPIGTTNR